MHVLGVCVLNEALVSSKQEITHKVMLKLHITANKVIVVISTATFVNNANCVEIYHMLFLSQTIDWYLWINIYYMYSQGFREGEIHCNCMDLNVFIIFHFLFTLDAYP